MSIWRALPLVGLLSCTGCLQIGAGVYFATESGGKTGDPGPTPYTVIAGTGGPDTLTGTTARERLLGFGGNDTLDGAEGDDRLEGGADDDLLIGGPGADQILGDAGIDTVDYTASRAGVRVDLAAGSGAGGDAQGDTLLGVECAIGSPFDDILRAGTGDSCLTGANGDDQLVGLGGADTLDGDAGDDTLNGGAGDDTLNGGDGDDALDGGPGGDAIDGGPGVDRLSYAASPSGVSAGIGGTSTGGDAEGDMLSNIEDVIGSPFDDTLTGFPGVVEGGAGGDSISGVAASGAMTTVSYQTSPMGVVVNLDVANQVGAGHENGDTLTNVGNVRGSSFNDTLTGLSGFVSVLEGGPGADRLIGSPAGSIASYEHSTGPVVVDLEADVANGSDAVGDDVSDPNLVGIIGGPMGDTLRGSLVVNNQLDGRAGADTIVGGNQSDTIPYDPADVSVDFLGGAIDRLVLGVNLDLGAPGPTITNMTEVLVPQTGGITLTVDPADVIATTSAALLTIEAAAASDAVIQGAGWTPAAPVAGYTVYVNGGTTLRVSTLITNTAGIVP